MGQDLWDTLYNYYGYSQNCVGNSDLNHEDITEKSCVDVYLKDFDFRFKDAIKWDKDLIEFWTRKDIIKKFGVLSMVALKVLTIPASTAPSERIFSSAGIIFNAKRQRLSVENVESLVFLNTFFTNI